MINVTGQALVRLNVTSVSVLLSLVYFDRFALCCLVRLAAAFFRITVMNASYATHHRHHFYTSVPTSIRSLNG